MKNRKAFVAVFLILMLMTGCSQAFDAETNTVYVKKDGAVMQAIIEEFNESNYDQNELEEIIKQDVSSYNNGTEAIKVEKYKVKDNIAKLITSYAKASDYAIFNDVEFFAGTISEAKTEGYEFDDMFMSVDENNTVGSETIKSLSQYKVVIFEENIRIMTDSKILYMSSNTKLIDAKTAVLNDDAEGLGYIIYE
ncbi:hypothetical protein [Candidatus Galacturonibacter soehngenii]|uniref:Uncharacterized protein n=1 Tax=Candidatus Galacturonatibacter soehngenii TaxID=2307010 RepID=A0A7V7QIW5_9FIRM|nr:hypothetical protein [Candidatus Galacturonibacter soehngenii]KAB1437497.1 hypothetical protein F7O84_07765 [Candidatus Galacturonibacter soehngenii]MBA4688433.1 hypothetical protein [Candidatus Galacturonibacter soehngenii]